MKLIERIVARHSQLTGWRQDIHAHPELRYQEHRTAAICAEELRLLGIEVKEGVGQTGVIGVLRGGAGSNRTVGFRADRLTWSMV